MADFVVLACEGAHQADAGEVLLQSGGEGALRLVGDLELRPHLGEEVVRARDDERHQHEREAGKPGVADEEYRRQDAEQQYGATDLHHLGGQEDAHRLDVRTAALHEIPGVRLVEEGRRQMLQPGIHRLPQPAGECLGRDRGPAALQVLAGCAQRREADAGNGGEHEIGHVRLATPKRRQRPCGVHECVGAPRQFLGVDHVEDVSPDQRYGEHERAREARHRNGSGVAQALSGGYSPERPKVAPALR